MGIISNIKGLFNRVGAAVCHPSNTVYSASGQPEQLGRELARGGEGAVHLLPGRPGVLVKLYFPQRLAADPGLADKLRAMAAIPLRDDRRFAWPRMTVHNASGRVTGFAMRQVAGLSFQTFCQPRLVLDKLPGWRRARSVAVARSFVGLLRTLHSHGAIAGDINPANFLFSPDTCEATCLDCDSYQVSTGGRIHLCRVGVPELQPPELQAGFSGITRTVEHERFCAAVMLFRLLMLGLHPYSHRDGGHPVENLRKGRIPFDPGAGKADRVRFPEGRWQPMWSHLPYAVKTLFIRAFADGHADPSARPGLDEWEQILQRYADELGRGWHSDELMPAAPKLPKPQKSRLAITLPPQPQATPAFVIRRQP